MQDFDAFPWRTVRQNLSLAGGLRGDSTEDAFGVDELLDKIGLAEHGNKYPAELSGGMRKRLGIGRCLAGKPKVILLDEPFASLDIDARNEMYGLVQSLWADWNCLFVIVTHNINEAVLLSKKIIISSMLPFRLKEIVPISLEYPRNGKILDSVEFLSIQQKIRQLLIPDL
jgi:NitT/TauT family transport system ATP-binding protein